MISTVSIIIRHAMGDERMALGVRTAYAAQTGGYETTLVLVGDAVYTLTGRLPEYLKNMISGFQESDGRLACLSLCAEERGLTGGEFSFENVDVLKQEELAGILEESDSVNVF